MDLLGGRNPQHLRILCPTRPTRGHIHASSRLIATNGALTGPFSRGGVESISTVSDALRPARLPSSIPVLRSLQPYHGIDQMEGETRNVFFSLGCGSGSGKGCEGVAGENKALDTSRGAGADGNAINVKRFSANFRRNEAWTPMSEPEIRTQGRLRGKHRWLAQCAHSYRHCRNTAVYRAPVWRHLLHD